MLVTRFKLPIARLVRFVLVGFVCALLTFAQALPAYAAKSKPTQGEAQLKKIEGKSIDILKAGGPTSMKKTIKEANKGLNEVQGDADIDKMNRPSNSRGAAPSIEQKIEQSLETLEGKTEDAVKSAKDLVK